MGATAIGRAMVLSAGYAQHDKHPGITAEYLRYWATSKWTGPSNWQLQSLYKDDTLDLCNSERFLGYNGILYNS